MWEILKWVLLYGGALLSAIFIRKIIGFLRQCIVRIISFFKDCCNKLFNKKDK